MITNPRQPAEGKSLKERKHSMAALRDLQGRAWNKVQTDEERALLSMKLAEVFRPAGRAWKARKG